MFVSLLVSSPRHHLSFYLSFFLSQHTLKFFSLSFLWTKKMSLFLDLWTSVCVCVCLVLWRFAVMAQAPIVTHRNRKISFILTKWHWHEHRVDDKKQPNSILYWLRVSDRGRQREKQPSRKSQHWKSNGWDAINFISQILCQFFCFRSSYFPSFVSSLFFLSNSYIKMMMLLFNFNSTKKKVFTQCFTICTLNCLFT